MARSSALHRHHDLDARAVAQLDVRPLRPRDDLALDGDRDAASSWRTRERLDHAPHGSAGRHLTGTAVDRHVHGHAVTAGTPANRAGANSSGTAPSPTSALTTSSAVIGVSRI